ncbi:MAG: hypothetical protein IBV52_08640 [Candidatus Bathyarchaeota archaeon]
MSEEKTETDKLKERVQSLELQVKDIQNQCVPKKTKTEEKPEEAEKLVEDAVPTEEAGLEETTE